MESEKYARELRQGTNGNTSVEAIGNNQQLCKPTRKMGVGSPQSPLVDVIYHQTECIEIFKRKKQCNMASKELSSNPRPKINLKQHGVLKISLCD